MTQLQDIDSSISLRDFSLLTPKQAEDEIKSLLKVNVDSPDLENQEKVKGMATYLQYLAKLHLLSGGNKEHADMLPDIVIGDFALEFDAVMPWALHFSLATRSLPTPAIFDMNKAEPVSCDFQNAKDYDLFTIPVRIPYVDMHLYPRMGHGFEDVASALAGVGVLPSDSFGVKRIAASFLLSGLLNYQTATRYDSDRTTLALVENAGNNYASALAKAILAGKIHACPHCTRPFLKSKESSMGYCSGSCRTLYNRAAKRLAKKDGANADTVHGQFPAIALDTIHAWFPTEGR